MKGNIFCFIVSGLVFLKLIYSCSSPATIVPHGRNRLDNIFTKDSSGSALKVQVVIFKRYRHQFFKWKRAEFMQKFCAFELLCCSLPLFVVAKV